ncbi:uncharacterized protein V1518DRAFT_294907 [Limtongia smithiae]|uniref:uncharacterized protein n=1 Tax=Limtongia smithiae TaxID=1125753 RepID=UPI0034CDBF2A
MRRAPYLSVRVQKRPQIQANWLASVPCKTLFHLLLTIYYHSNTAALTYKTPIPLQLHTKNKMVSSPSSTGKNGDIAHVFAPKDSALATEEPAVLKDGPVELCFEVSVGCLPDDEDAAETTSSSNYEFWDGVSTDDEDYEDYYDDTTEEDEQMAEDDEKEQKYDSKGNTVDEEENMMDDSLYSNDEYYESDGQIREQREDFLASAGIYCSSCCE